jgi:hypothetical protein
METRRLRKLQQPSQVERLLDTLISRAKLVPADSYPIRDPKTLPADLRRIALQSVTEGQVWACWVLGLQHWLFTAAISLDGSRERKKPVLRVNCYDDQGELTDTGCWMADPDGQWGRCSD